MTYQEREQETVRRLREEWEERYRAERLLLKQTEARANQVVLLDAQAQILYELTHRY